MLTMEEKLNSYEFYELMQQYRWASVNDQKAVTEAFNKVIEFILNNK